MAYRVYLQPFLKDLPCLLSLSRAESVGENLILPANFSSRVVSPGSGPPRTREVHRVLTPPEQQPNVPPTPSTRFAWRKDLGRKQPESKTTCRPQHPGRRPPPTRARFKRTGGSSGAVPPLPVPALAAPTWGRCAGAYFSRGGISSPKRGRDCVWQIRGYQDFAGGHGPGLLDSGRRGQVSAGEQWNGPGKRARRARRVRHGSGVGRPLRRDGPVER